MVDKVYKLFHAANQRMNDLLDYIRIPDKMLLLAFLVLLVVELIVD